MTRKLKHPSTKKYHEDQLVFILMSYRFRINRIEKIIASPIFEAPTQIRKIKVELAEILRQLKQLGWYVPNLHKQ
ncbi:hypothetical protein [Carboxylicivirga marina]|uniref:Uncharacterized protein n=1 Tax=Carboxylicivirga marina TaxID=2800988 RepID=A0ABS1HH65_9BACT|nr:hypothetical protein [Carboxylicivirga marina]MBK3516931.1 hypothetical protein [Carboxylicivirga marina]